MLAVEVPLLKKAALATAALGVMLGMSSSHRAHHGRHRLALHAPKRCHAIYMTAWEHGDITITRDDSKLETITFQTQEVIPDGSTWLGTEVLVPIDAHTYHYSYDEAVLATPPEGTRYIRTPREGYVTVED